jgi:hypothetical protein
MYYNNQQTPWATASNTVSYGQPAQTSPSGPVAANEKTLLFSDGRIQEADGGHYKFRGAGTYSLLKDQGVDLRGNFEHVEGTDKLILNEAGLIIDNQLLNIRGDGNVSLSNGNTAYRKIEAGQSQDLGNGIQLSHHGKALQVKTAEYILTFNMDQPGIAGDKAMNISFQTRENGVNGDNALPTGLIGETFDADKHPLSQNKHQLRSGEYKQDDLPGRLYKWNPDHGKVGYVEVLYGNILGRQPSGQEELFQLSDKIMEGGARGAILHLMNSQEFQAKNYGNERKAEILYKAILNRKATVEEVASSTEKLNNGQSIDSIADELFYSPEYLEHYKNGKMPSPMSNKEAVQTLYNHYNPIWQLNRRNNPHYFFHDQYIHRKNFETVLNGNEFDIRTKTAAKCILDNETLFRNLDAANGSNAPDDKIGSRDFEAILNDSKINTY